MLFCRLSLPCASRLQHGAALLLALLLLVLVLSVLLFADRKDAVLQARREADTIAALAQAKQALLGYAMSYDDTHPSAGYGYLPCPDTSASDSYGEGGQLSCGSLNLSVLGRLPWRVLDLGPLRDGAGECLWYAVSGTYKNNPKLTSLTPATPGLLQVFEANGAGLLGSGDDPVVAVLIAPGPALQGQQRQVQDSTLQCPGSYSPAAYLDRDTVSGIDNSQVAAQPGQISSFIAAARASAFNDRLLVVTRREVFTAYCRKTAVRMEARSMAGECSAGGGVHPDCAIWAARLTDFCQPPSCIEAAQTLVSASCLASPQAADCAMARDGLQACRHG